MKRIYIKRGIWYLGGRKKQRGGFLPILGALAWPQLISEAGAVGGEILKEFGKKNFGVEKEENLEEEDEE